VIFSGFPIMQSSTFGVYHFWLLLVRVQLRFVFSFFLHFLVDFHISIIKLQVMVNMKDVKNASDVVAWCCTSLGAQRSTKLGSS